MWLSLFIRAEVPNLILIAGKPENEVLQDRVQKPPLQYMPSIQMQITFSINVEILIKSPKYHDII